MASTGAAQAATATSRRPQPGSLPPDVTADLTPEAAADLTPGAPATPAAASAPGGAAAGEGARRRGRPRDVRADEVILDAAAGVLAAVGAQGFTVDAVAVAAGVGKATIYRRWPTRADLVLAAAGRIGLELEPPETGNLRDDLVIHLTHLADKLANTPSGRLLIAIIGEAAVNEEMRTRLRAFVHQRRALALGLITEAREGASCRRTSTSTSCWTCSVPRSSSACSPAAR